MLSSYMFLLLTARPTTDLYTLSLHDALPILRRRDRPAEERGDAQPLQLGAGDPEPHRQGEEREPDHRGDPDGDQGDRKSTRLNSSHRCISYAVFCLKKKNSKNLDSTNSCCAL